MKEMVNKQAKSLTYAENAAREEARILRRIEQKNAYAKDVVDRFALMQKT